MRAESAAGQSVDAIDRCFRQHVTETNGNDKPACSHSCENPNNPPLEKSSRSAGRALTTTQGFAIAEQQNSLKAGCAAALLATSSCATDHAFVTSAFPSAWSTRAVRRMDFSSVRAPDGSAWPLRSRRGKRTRIVRFSRSPRVVLSTLRATCAFLPQGSIPIHATGCRTQHRPVVLHSIREIPDGHAVKLSRIFDAAAPAPRYVLDLRA